jgi:hypothetical protein
MANNPFNGVMINNKYYNFVPGTYKTGTPLKNTSIDTQNKRTFSIGGKSFDLHRITLALENTYIVYGLTGYETQLGETTWTGISRLADLKTDLGALGASLPICFISPFGVSQTVVATGTIDVDPMFQVPQPS